MPVCCVLFLGKAPKRPLGNCYLNLSEQIHPTTNQENILFQVSQLVVKVFRKVTHALMLNPRLHPCLRTKIDILVNSAQS